MEFDMATRAPSATAMEMIKAQFAASGYTVPSVAFWNIQSRQDNVPVKMNEKGVALVSGFSPAIIKSILVDPLNLTPQGVMMSALNNERYEAVTV